MEGQGLERGNLGTQVSGSDIWMDTSEDIYAATSLRFSEHTEMAHPSLVRTSIVAELVMPALTWSCLRLYSE